MLFKNTLEKIGIFKQIYRYREHIWGCTYRGADHHLLVGIYKFQAFRDKIKKQAGLVLSMKWLYRMMGMFFYVNVLLISLLYNHTSKKNQFCILKKMKVNSPQPQFNQSVNNKIRFVKNTFKYVSLKIFFL